MPNDDHKILQIGLEQYDAHQTEFLYHREGESLYHSMSCESLGRRYRSIHESKFHKASCGLALRSGLGRFLFRLSWPRKLGSGPRRTVFLQISCRSCLRTGAPCVPMDAKEDARGPWLMAASVSCVCAGVCALTDWLRGGREDLLRDAHLSFSPVLAGAAAVVRWRPEK